MLLFVMPIQVFLDKITVNNSSGLLCQLAKSSIYSTDADYFANTTFEKQTSTNKMFTQRNDT